MGGARDIILKEFPDVVVDRHRMGIKEISTHVRKTGEMNLRNQRAGYCLQVGVRIKTMVGGGDIDVIDVE